MATVPQTRAAWWREWPLALTVLMLGIMLAFGGTLAGTSSSALVLIVLLGLCGVILCAAVAIVRHADVLAHRLGEPLGTLLLTLAITGLEVAMVGFVMSTGDEKPTLARDTMFASGSVLMARIFFDAIAPTQCWMAPEMPHAR